MAVATQTREEQRQGRKEGRRFRLPVPRMDLAVIGAVLALASWGLQSYATARWMEQDRLRAAEFQRQMWLIEYNASLFRIPGNQRVSARAAYHVLINTRDVLAAAKVTREGADGKPVALAATMEEDLARAQTLLDEGRFGDLVAELNDVNRIYESHDREQPHAVSLSSITLPWWQHVLPWTLLAGILMCAAGRNRWKDRTSRED